MHANRSILSRSPVDVCSVSALLHGLPDLAWLALHHASVAECGSESSYRPCILIALEGLDGLLLGEASCCVSIRFTDVMGNTHIYIYIVR